jgi:uridine kinase
MENVKIGTILILRGLPGTGKSTLAEVLKLVHKDSVILSSDDYFYDSATKTHKFDKEKLVVAHEWNFDRFKKAIEDKVPNIIVDNSNIKNFHYHHYLDYGQRHDYMVAIVTIPHNDVSDRELAVRNIHGVTRWTILKMKKEWEWVIE